MRRSVHFLPGWGFSARLGGALLGDAVAYLVQHDSPPAPGDIPHGSVLIGWSLGAMRALQIASQAPERIAGLFLIGANLRFAACPNWPHGLPGQQVADFRRSFSQTPARTLQRFLALQAVGDAQAAQTLACLRPHLLNEQTERERLEAGLAELEAFDLRSVALPASLPVHLLHGAHDALMPASAATAIGQRLPQATLEIVATAGHAPLFHAPECLTARIKAFLDACH